jgi:hypothetical protein
MNLRQMIPLGLATLLGVAGAGYSNPAHAGTLTYEILANTSGLLAGAGLIDIQLNPSAVPSSATVTAQVFGANPIGDVGTVTFTAGTAAGDLSKSAGVTMNNSMLTNEQTQNFTVTSFFDVFVQLSGTEIGPGATGSFTGTVFTLNIYDSKFDSVGATLTVNPKQGIVDGTVGISTTGPQVSVNAVPEPSGIVMMGLGLGALVAIARRRRARAAA